MDVLEQKAKWNSEIAVIAEKKEHYDVAVSRYYYSLFQIVAWLLKKENHWDYTTCFEQHKVIGNQLTVFVKMRVDKNLIQKHDYVLLNNWKKIKDTRHSADYKDDCLLSKVDFDTFKERFLGLRGLLERNSLIPR